MFILKSREKGHLVQASFRAMQLAQVSAFLNPLVGSVHAHNYIEPPCQMTSNGSMVISLYPYFSSIKFLLKFYLRRINALEILFTLNKVKIKQKVYGNIGIIIRSNVSQSQTIRHSNTYYRIFLDTTSNHIILFQPSIFQQILIILREF